MKKISVTIPCWSEEKSVRQMYDRLTKIFIEKLPQYDYEIIYVDDYSPDNTRVEIRKLCAADKHVKAVFNARNFGFSRNVFAALRYGTGDATFMLFGDLQDPPELLPQMVAEWEKGKKVIIGQRTKGHENALMYSMRKLYYWLMEKLADSRQLEHFNGFGLYDKSFVDVLKELDDPAPYLKGIVSELAIEMSIIPYEQAESLRGKSGANFLKNYDLAMLGITSYTKILMRLATFVGAGLGIVSALFAVFVLISKLLNWNSYPYGTATIIIGVFFIGAVQLFFTGILGEYILSINTRSMRRPLVVVGEKLNFEEEDREKEA
ncbi:MAG: glycosyltransferase family 2 protein [Agathobaculum sp.]|uniref:glycosyltransferase family 2 protein n=1 Tax=Agathobaculum sp. TaxID=2048138 RepID=UPI0025C27C91|nr:glycosyltransferase family 2 protein [Agathobaculum sp.]MDY3711844.1 glycosyltransferase family 2 protein [Agathobaculum sp.]